MNTPLLQLIGLTVAVAALFGGLAYWTSHRDTWRQRAIQGFAERTGWAYEDAGPDFAWRLRRGTGVREAMVFAVEPSASQSSGSRAPAFTRCLLPAADGVHLLIQPRAVSAALPPGLNPIPQMVGAAYSTAAAWPEVPGPETLMGTFEFRAPDGGTIAPALPAPAVDRMAKYATTPAQALPVVAIHDGRLVAVIPGRALWSPDEVEAFIGLCEALSSTAGK